MIRFLILSVTHVVALMLGVALGIYALPIVIAPPAPDVARLQAAQAGAAYTASFSRDLPGSDGLHWGEGQISLSPGQISHMGKLAPGPDYKLYLVPEFVDSEAAFRPLKAKSVQVGDVNSFKGFILDLPDDIDIEDYNTVLIWCETFSEFITAAKYR